MPAIDGLTLVSKIREVGIQIPIIICTGFCAKNLNHKIKKLGIHSVLNKPNTRESIAIAVADALLIQKAHRDFEIRQIH